MLWAARWHGHGQLYRMVGVQGLGRGLDCGSLVGGRLVAGPPASRDH